MQSDKCCGTLIKPKNSTVKCSTRQNSKLQHNTSTDDCFTGGITVRTKQNTTEQNTIKQNIIKQHMTFISSAKQSSEN
uniref:Uncharacterized protein n=1 Tax=Siphoviridae sp. ctEJG5 TaxID=2827814 RepID=A0A8S5RY07_9CAUD|nr:MAG TPA: hypothetical protein [Siphoviridae sp. ctEJG5]